jgi:hypothetical protein
MSITLSKFSSSQTPVVSSRGNLDEGDVNSPYSFQEWIKRNVGILPTQYVTDYNKYLQNWYKTNATIKANTSSEASIKETYKNFLRQIAISFKDAEEARLFTDINFDDDFEVASIVPLIARKLKAIAAYYASKRETVKPSKLKYNMTGTNRAIERILYQYILRSFTKYPYNYTVNDQTLTNAFSALSAICNTFEIQVEELYDESTYFDSTSSVPISAYTDYTQSVNFISFSGLTTDVLKVLHETRFYDATLTETLVGDLSYLFEVIADGKVIDSTTSPGYDSSQTYPLTSFTDYVSGSQVNSYYEPILAAKYLGSDYYALSTDSTGKIAASGRYLRAVAPYAHFNNAVNPTIATVPSYEGLVTIEDVGGYHTPIHIGALTFAAVSPEVRITTEALSANTVYFVADPNLYTSIRGTSLSSHYSPIVHNFEFSWLKQRNTNLYSEGLIRDLKGYPTFKAYQSKYESRKFDGNGIQRVDDSYQFWSGETASNWTRQDIYPLNWRGEYNIDARTNVLDISGNQIVNWNTDIYGNHYTLYKNIKTSAGEYLSVYDKRHNTTGELWVRTPYDTIVRGVSALSSVFAKYANNTAVYQELLSSEIYSFDVVYDVLIIELENYVLFEKIEFDYDTNTFKNTNTTSKLFNLSASNVFYGGFWFHEKENRLTVSICISSSYGGIPYFYPELYRVDLTDFSMEKIYSGYEDTSLLLPTTATFVDVDAPILTYNNDTDTFNVSLLGKDAGKKCYIVSMDVSDRV